MDKEQGNILKVIIDANNKLSDGLDHGFRHALIWYGTVVIGSTGRTTRKILQDVARTTTWPLGNDIFIDGKPPRRKK